MVQKPPRQADLAKIHLAKKQLGMDDASYRAMLQRVAGVESAAALDVDGRSRVLRHLHALGFRPRPPRGLASRGQSRKIRWLWIDLHAAGVVRDPTERAMRKYIRRMTGVGHEDRLSTAQASAVIEALKQWRRRSGPPGAGRPSADPR